MRKRIKNKKLSRSTNQRKALFKSLIVALVQNEEIQTTKARGQAIRKLVEKLITKGKAGSLHARRLIQSMIQDKGATAKIVEDLAKRFENRKGGYTRVQNLANRRGDNAPMVLVSLKEKKEKEQGSSSKTKKTKGAKSAKPQKPDVRQEPRDIEKPKSQASVISQPTRQKKGQDQRG